MSVQEDILQYLRICHALTLCTSGEDGRPWGAAVFYVNIGFELFFLSEGKTRHALNLGVNPRVAATVQEDYPDWKAIKGIQLEGQVEVVQGALERAKVMAAYVRKFPSVASFISHPRLGRLVREAHLYRLRPEVIYYLDNAQGFSHREEFRPDK